jgi:hypothetical protein
MQVIYNARKWCARRAAVRDTDAQAELVNAQKAGNISGGRVRDDLVLRLKHWLADCSNSKIEQLMEVSRRLSAVTIPPQHFLKYPRAGMQPPGEFAGMRAAEVGTDAVPTKAPTWRSRVEIATSPRNRNVCISRWLAIEVVRR